MCDANEKFCYSLHFVILAVASGIVNVICLMVAPVYFEKRRGSAIAIVMTGSGVGQVMLPLIIRALIDAFSFRGVILVFGAIIGHCCVAALLFHPVEWHQKGGKKQHRQPHCPQSMDQTEQYEEEIKTSGYFAKIILRINILPTVAKLLRTTYEHILVVKNFRITMGAISIAVLIIGYANFLALVPFAMQDRGYPPHYSSLCISLSSISNVLFRIVTSCVSDRPWFNRRVSYIFSASSAGITSIGKYQRLLYHRTCKCDFLCSWPSLNSYLK